MKQITEKRHTINFLVKGLFTVAVTLATCLIIACNSGSDSGDFKITVDRTTVGMGHSVTVDVSMKQGSSFTLFAYVNNRRWGSHEFADGQGKATFHIPLPNVGPAKIEVLAVDTDKDKWYGVTDYAPYLTGKLMPEMGLRSNAVMVEVQWRDIKPAKQAGTVFVSQWEPWFAPGRMWSTAHAVPLLGFYDFTNADVLRQHLLWLMDSGADAVLFDWSNHIWGRKSWDERDKGVNMILHATQMALEMMADMRDEGLPVPKAIIMSGISNGPPATMQALNEQLQWIYLNYLNNPRFDGLWEIFDGKPLLTVLDTGALGAKEATTKSAFEVPFFKQTMDWTEEQIDAHRRSLPPVDDSHFTIRWMSSQNQVTGHDKFGHWSWMDAGARPLVTYKDGVAEAFTANIGSFGPQGWKGVGALGRRNGWTMVESFKVVQETRPKYVMLHQFNEFTGQSEGHGYGPDRSIYVDSYSVELSDDYEPVSLTAPGYRGDKGGWGFFYLNLIRSLIDIYNGSTPDATILTVAPATLNGSVVDVEWTTFGREPKDFTVSVNGKQIGEPVTGLGTSLSVSAFRQGTNTIQVVANGVTGRYALSATRLDVLSPEPLKVEAIQEFTLK